MGISHSLPRMSSISPSWDLYSPPLTQNCCMAILQISATFWHQYSVKQLLHSQCFQYMFLSLLVSYVLMLRCKGISAHLSTKDVAAAAAAAAAHVSSYEKASSGMSVYFTQFKASTWLHPCRIKVTFCCLAYYTTMKGIWDLVFILYPPCLCSGPFINQRWYSSHSVRQLTCCQQNCPFCCPSTVQMKVVSVIVFILLTEKLEQQKGTKVHPCHEYFHYPKTPLSLAALLWA